MSLDHIWARRRAPRWIRLGLLVVVAAAAFALGALTSGSSTRPSATVTRPTVAAAADPTADNCLVEPLGPMSRYRLSVRGLQVVVVGPSFFYCNVTDGEGSGASTWVEGAKDTSGDTGSIGITVEACVTCNFDVICPYSGAARARLTSDAGPCPTHIASAARVTYLLGSATTADVMVEVQDRPTATDDDPPITIYAYDPSTELATFTCSSSDAHATYCVGDARTFATSMTSEFF